MFGTDIPGLTDKEIEESLWYYYFDVPKTINYILSVPPDRLGKLTVLISRKINMERRNSIRRRRRRSRALHRPRRPLQKVHYLLYVLRCFPTLIYYRRYPGGT